jgi:hypothetical protein
MLSSSQGKSSSPLLTREPALPPKLPPHVVRVTNKTGRPYLYLHKYRGTARAEQRVRLPDDPNQPEFWTAYAALMHVQVPEPRTDTIDALIAVWQASPEFQALGTGTSIRWKRHCQRIAEAWGPIRVAHIKPENVLTLRDLFAATPAHTNNMLRCLSSMLGWSVPRGWRPDNPCREVKPLKGGQGYAPWMPDVIEAARLDLRPDLWWVVAVALYTGQRLGDCLAMRWSAINAAGLISVRQEKTDKFLLIPIHRDLKTVLDTIPRRAVTILTSTEGTPWRGFQATWGKHKPTSVKEHGLVFHGLRKSAVVQLLEAGCTDAEVSAITGQTRKMVEHYAKEINQKKMALAAMRKWEQGTN